MGKKLNEWLNEFVENGADASNVVNWPNEAGGENTFAIIIELENDTMLDCLPNQFSIVEFDSSDEGTEGDTLYSGNVVFISDLNALKLDIPLNQLTIGENHTPCGKKIKLEFEGLMDELGSEGRIEASGSDIYFFWNYGNIVFLEMGNYFYTGIFPSFGRLNADNSPLD